MIVYAEPGLAIDWDWSTELTVWQTGHDRVGRRITRHRLDRRPADQHAAEVAAKRWWRHESSSAPTSQAVAVSNPLRPMPAASDDVGRYDVGGDPACWAHRVCQACGRLNEAEQPVVCEACGSAFPDADD